MKKILCLVICVAMFVSMSICVSAEELDIFTDVDESSEVGLAILTLYAEGIVKGYGDGTFGVDKNLTRAEFSRMVNLVFNYTEAGENMFSDVSETDWFYNDVLIAVKAGFIAGFEDGTFRGNENVTRQQAFSVINRIKKFTVEGENPVINDAVDAWAEHDVYALLSNGYVKLEEG